MTAPYRDELAALEARYAALEAEVADRERARDEAARMLAEAKARARNEEIIADIRAGGPERRHERRVIAATAGILAVVAGGAYLIANRKPSSAERFEAAYKQFERFTNETCACTTKACADEVQTRFTTWAEEMARTTDQRADRPDEQQMKRFSVLAERYTECLMTKMTLEVERPDP